MMIARWGPVKIEGAVDAPECRDIGMDDFTALVWRE
jgi:hypothetical protein